MLWTISAQQWWSGTNNGITMLILLAGWWRHDAYSLGLSGKSAGTGNCLTMVTWLLFSWLVWQQYNVYSLFWLASESMGNGRLLNDSKSGWWWLLNDGNAMLIFLAGPANWQAKAANQQWRYNAYSLGWSSNNANLILSDRWPANQWAMTNCPSMARAGNGHCLTTATQRLFSRLVRRIGGHGQLLDNGDGDATLINGWRRAVLMVINT